MAQLLLSTKLFFPRARSNLVSRPRLIEQLNMGLHRPLTLISAPAGYGKTTLLSDWRARYGGEYPLAWLSLDTGDDNLTRFLTYVAAALETLDPKLPQDLLSLLYLPQLPPMEELITALASGANTFPQDFALVLDDCHVITDPAIHAALAYLLDHLSPQMHMVMLTRADPPIHLARLRVRGDLMELRADDLRFTSQESALFLNTVMGLQLSAADVTALDQRTEGWIVGLQMAALSMQGKEDTAGFIQAFTGSNRYILDFLSEEVLQQQPPAIQEFLLHTSILERLTGPLCDAVLGETRNSAHILLELERINLFLIPLDDERRWYRYHHLFSSLLFQFLKQSQPALINSLYQRAAAWLEQNGYPEDAIGYALKAQDFDQATRLMYQIRTNLLNHGEVHSLLNWINTLPEELVRSHPELCFHYATYLTMLGSFDAAEKWLQQAEAGLGSMANADRPPGLKMHRFLIYRSVYARYKGDYPGAIALIERASELTPRLETRDWGVVLLFMGQAYLHAGTTQAAERVLQDAIQANLLSGHLEAFMNASHNLAQLRVMQGRLQDARAIYERAAQVARDHGASINSGTEHACLGELFIEWNQLEKAAAEIQQGIALAEAGDHIFFLTDVYLARLLLAMVQKEWETAWSILHKAEKVVRRCPASIELELLRSWQARLHLAQGNLAEAGAWANTLEAEPQGLEMPSPLPPQQEWCLLTLARVWLAQGKVDRAATLLENIYKEAEAAGRHGRTLEIQVLQVLAAQASGNEPQAVETLVQALTQAEPEGYVRIFIDEGTPLVKLLYKLASQAPVQVQDYAKRLIAAYLETDVEPQALQPKPLPGEALIAPLSQRELEVLLLMANGCSNKEIASQLVITIGTVKRHVIHILQKLKAANRTQAVAIARQLEIV